MKTKIFFLVFILTAVLGVELKAQNNTNEDKKLTEVTDSVYYTCSMHPEIKSSAPGVCPKCGMNLIKQTVGQENQNKMQMDCGMMKGMDMGKNGTMKGGKSANQDSIYYTCSMHPDIVSDKPGNCPKCGMVLEKKTVSQYKKQKPGKMKMGGCGTM